MATARQFEFTQEEIDSEGGGGAYAELEVPNDYQVTLIDVSDYDKREDGKTQGWVWTYEVDTPSGASVTFRTWTSFGKNARWKLLEVLEAHGVDVEAGIADVDPDDFIGDIVGGTIDFPRDKAGDPTSDFREITTLFPLVDSPVDAEVAEVL